MKNQNGKLAEMFADRADWKASVSGNDRNPDGLADALAALAVAKPNKMSRKHKIGLVSMLAIRAGRILSAASTRPYPKSVTLSRDCFLDILLDVRGIESITHKLVEEK